MPPETGCGASRSATGEVVYFVQGIDGGPIKIGYSSTRAGVEARLASLQCGNPVKLVVRRIIHGDRYTELKMHERFARYRLEGEWFMATVEVAMEAHAPDMKARDPLRRLLPWLERAYQSGLTRGRWEAEETEARAFRERLMRFADDYAPMDDVEREEWLKRHAEEYAQLQELARIRERAA